MDHEMYEELSRTLSIKEAESLLCQVYREELRRRGEEVPGYGFNYEGDALVTLRRLVNRDQQ